MSPIAKMCGTFVRCCLSTLMRPRSLTSTPALLGGDPAAVRAAADGDQHAAVGLRLRRRLIAFEVHRDAARPGFHLHDARAEHDGFVARRDPLLERLHEIAIAARDQRLRELDDRHLHAERVVHRRHLEADDAAADDEHALAAARRARARPSNR